MSKPKVAIVLAFSLLFAVGAVGVTPASATLTAKVERKQVKKVCTALIRTVDKIRTTGRFLSTADLDALTQRIAKSAKKSRDKKLIKAVKKFASAPNGEKLGAVCSRHGFPGDYVTPPALPADEPALQGYPKLVPLTSVDARVQSWVTINPPPSDQLVEVGPGVFAIYNPAVPDFSIYVGGPVVGDCAVIAQYFAGSGSVCWDGVSPV